MTIEITFLRHGRSRADDEGVHEGRYDSPLTDVGVAQVRARAAGWKAAGMRFDAIVASPLQRAHRTAEIVGEALGLPVEPGPDWMEMDEGPLAGLPFDVARERYPPPDFRNPYEPVCVTGESAWELYQRAARGVEQVVRRGAGAYLVVAHGGILNAAMRAIIGVPPRIADQGISFWFGDTGYVSFLYQPEQHTWSLYTFERGIVLP